MSTNTPDPERTESVPMPANERTESIPGPERTESMPATERTEAQPAAQRTEPLPRTTAPVTSQPVASQPVPRQPYAPQQAPAARPPAAPEVVRGPYLAPIILGLVCLAVAAAAFAQEIANWTIDWGNVGPLGIVIAGLVLVLLGALGLLSSRRRRA